MCLSAGLVYTVNAFVVGGSGFVSTLSNQQRSCELTVFYKHSWTFSLIFLFSCDAKGINVIFVCFLPSFIQMQTYILDAVDCS